MSTSNTTTNTATNTTTSTTTNTKIRKQIYEQKYELEEYNIRPTPKFYTSDECKAFIQNGAEMVSKLIDYPIITDYNKLWTLIESGINTDTNTDNDNDNPIKLPKKFATIMDNVTNKKKIYIGKGSLKDRIKNTLHYLYYHMRSGIYCRIENNKVKQFLIFVNPDYTNNWHQYLTFENADGKIVSKEQYYYDKRKYYRRENIIPLDKWWCNGHMFDNEHGPTLWGQHLVTSIVDMLYHLTQCKKIKDKSFFINKRDYPQLRYDLTEPYDFLFPEKTKIPDRYTENGVGFIPIYSFFSSNVFADILIPSTDDWDTVTGLIPLSDNPSDKYADTNYLKYKGIKWSDKKNYAFFRGSGTGGPTIESNQRFMLAKLSADLNDPSILDAGIVTWNIRDKKISSDQPVTFPRKDKLGFQLSSFVPMSEQMKIKYIIYVDGHCAAARYIYLMKMKVLILKIESIRPETAELWFFPLLEDGVDHVSVKSDLSDLVTKIKWCQDHDDECKKIAKEAYRKYKKYLNKDKVLDYFGYLINEI